MGRYIFRHVIKRAVYFKFLKPPFFSVTLYQYWRFAFLVVRCFMKHTFKIKRVAREFEITSFITS